MRYPITEGKYRNQLEKIRKFRDVLSSGSHEIGGTVKKVTASDLAKPGPHIQFFFESGVTGTCRNGDEVKLKLNDFRNLLR